MPRLRTARLVLRPPQEHDIPRIVAACSSPDVARYIPHIPVPYTEADAREWLAHASANSFAITLDDVLLGVVSVEDGSLGYWLHPDARGRGVMAEALAAVVRWAGDRDLVLTAHPENVASRRVAEKAGFVAVGTVAHDPPFRDGVREAIRYESCGRRRRTS
jgi:ribosomal-protein-alanine N-acetyltransferase